MNKEKIPEIIIQPLIITSGTVEDENITDYQKPGLMYIDLKLNRVRICAADLKFRTLIWSLEA